MFVNHPLADEAKRVQRRCDQILDALDSATGDDRAGLLRQYAEADERRAELRRAMVVEIIRARGLLTASASHAGAWEARARLH